MKGMRLFQIGLGVSVAFFALSSLAQTTSLPMTHGVWSADAYVGQNSQRVCELTGWAREEPLQLFSLWHGYGTINRFHLSGFAAHSPVTVTVGEYAETWQTDAAGRINLAGVSKPTLIVTMRTLAPKGGVLTVEGRLASGRPVVLTYPLSGFPEAYAAINEGCGVRE